MLFVVEELVIYICIYIYAYDYFVYVNCIFHT